MGSIYSNYAGFWWVVCQLDMLRRCFPVSLREALRELPYDIGRNIRANSFKHLKRKNENTAHRLFNCLAVSVRPLRVEELAEGSWRWRFNSGKVPDYHSLDGD